MYSHLRTSDECFQVFVVRLSQNIFCLSLLPMKKVFEFDKVDKLNLIKF